jgi:hypothetical protein
MKKVYKILLCLVLIVILAQPVWAASGSVTLTPSAEKVQSGKSFTVDVFLDNSDAINLCTVVVSYDESALELVGGTCHVSGTAIAQVIPEKKAATLLVTLPKKVSGKIFTFEFRVKNSAAHGTYEIDAKAAIGTSGGNYIDAKGARITVACNHSPEEQWRSNNAEHWRFCTDCGERLDVAKHAPKVAEGKKCTVCGYKPTGNPSQNTPTTDATEQESVTPTKPQNPEETAVPEESTQPTEQTQPEVPDDTQNATEPTTPTTEQAPKKSDTVAWVIVVLLIAGGAAAFVIWRKKKK